MAHSPQASHQACNDLLHELAAFLTNRVESRSSFGDSSYRPELERLVRDASASLTEIRPPANLVVYADGTTHWEPPPDAIDATVATTTLPHNNHLRAWCSTTPPVFDGSVANATPPPLGHGNGPAGGAGTILHLACAVDNPLALAFLLAIGADARSSHTAFRRLVVHEAACNGSLQCLTLLLETGRRLREMNEPKPARTTHSCSPTSASEFNLPYLPRRVQPNVESTTAVDSSETDPSCWRPYRAESSKLQCESEPELCRTRPSLDFVSLLWLFRDCAEQVKRGEITTLDAARQVLDYGSLSGVSKASLARSCALGSHLHVRSIGRPPGGTADGHGNTPLHWAAFKNETECVNLLLRYGSDPNARAHPSGWTPLHDAAYSNSRECIALLMDAGALVDARANSGATPLCFAAQEDSAEAAALLLRYGSDLQTRCAGGPVRDDNTIGPGGNPLHPHSRFSGYTPLHYCAHYNAHEAARVLLKHPTALAATEMADLNDRLPIHVAVARGSSDVLRELLHAGARVETRSRSYSQDSYLNDFGRPVTPIRLGSTAPPAPERVATPRRAQGASPRVSTPVSSPMLRSMIPSQPVMSAKPWNCLTQRSIDECRHLVAEAEKQWAPDRHLLFTPNDRRAVMQLLRVGKRLELDGTGIFIDLWPQVLSFCGRGWFEIEEVSAKSAMSEEMEPANDKDRGFAEGSDRSFSLSRF
jgi:hypothetical protein